MTPEETGLAGEFLVVNALDARPAVAEVVVAQPGFGQVTGGILAQVVLPLLVVPSQLLAVGGEDEPRSIFISSSTARVLAALIFRLGAAQTWT